MKLGLGRDKKGQSYFQMAYYSTEKVQVLKKKLTQCDDIRNWEFGEVTKFAVFSNSSPKSLEMGAMASAQPLCGMLLWHRKQV